jgi:uncharacterized protein YcfJ
MKSILVVGALLFAAPLVTSPAFAAGCIKGAVVGGVLGHVAGHGAVGAAAGCAVGHHEANKASNTNAKPDQSASGNPR